MKRTYDVAVVGLGVAGASAAAELAGRGARVIGLDRFRPPHTLGSSHGETRITRAAYFERPLYVPLVRRAQELWRRIAERTGRTLTRDTGVLNIGPAGGVLVRGALESAVEHGIAHEVLSATEIARRWPGLRPRAGMVGVLEPSAGLLFPEQCVAALHEDARARGAELRFDVAVQGWVSVTDGVRLTTAAGEVRAGAVVFAAGPWLGALVGDAGLPLSVERQVTAWFEPGVEAYGADGCPVTLWELEDGTLFYACPDVGAGMKAALHHGGGAAHPDSVDRGITEEDVAPVRALVHEFLPLAAGEPARASICLYTNTPDHDFVIDLHPREPRVAIVSACSGHGFKFGPAVGELAADLVSGARSGPPAAFSLSRFDAPGAGSATGNARATAEG
jgi:sarcosine oxidase